MLMLQIHLSQCILVDYFYLVMVDCFSLRSKGQEPESSGLHVETEGTEWLKVEGRNKRISPPSCLGWLPLTCEHAEEKEV